MKTLKKQPIYIKKLVALLGTQIEVAEFLECNRATVRRATVRRAIEDDQVTAIYEIAAEAIYKNLNDRLFDLIDAALVTYERTGKVNKAQMTYLVAGARNYVRENANVKT